ncbi:hypothetical protein ADLP1_073 [Acinetobacter phage vB_AbaM_DLP1]|nr:hypothetical protein ADLP1_073 [Acinetobacter phage vB_AbaM_DLP1]
MEQVEAIQEDDVKGPSGALYEKSLSIIKDAMKDVKHELLIKLEDGTDHIVYITEFQISGNGVTYGFSTPSEDRKAELIPHIEYILKEMIVNFSKRKKPFSF